MTAPSIYEVAPHGDDRWHVKRRGAGQPDSIHKHKVDAVTRARRLCRAAQSSQLVILRRDSTIELVRTYGEEPFSPRD